MVIEPRDGVIKGHDSTFKRLVADKRHPSILSLLQYFTYEHLPPRLQEVSKQFANLAFGMAIRTPDSAELTAGLRKLLEAKDCFVRASLTDNDRGQYSWTDR